METADGDGHCQTLHISKCLHLLQILWEGGREEDEEEEEEGGGGGESSCTHTLNMWILLCTSLSQNSKIHVFSQAIEVVGSKVYIFLSC